MNYSFRLSGYDVRTMCIKMNLCTGMYCEQYSDLLEMCNFEVNNFDILTAKLLEIATIIYNYSVEQTITNIMFCLMKDCVNTFFDEV